MLAGWARSARQFWPGPPPDEVHPRSERATCALTDKGRTLAGVLPRPGGEGGVVGVVTAERLTTAPTSL